MATRDWSSLPVDLLATIALKSESFEYFIYFSAVCRSWNRASSSIKHQWSSESSDQHGVPWLLLAESKKENPDCLREVFNPSNNKCYKLRLPETFRASCWGSAYGWIVMAKHDFTVQLFNPITKANISDFPSWEILTINMPEWNRPTENPDFDWLVRNYLKRIIVLKVSQSYVIFIIYNEATNLVFAREGDKSWTSVLIEGWTSVYDVVAAEEEEGDGRVFALTRPASIVYWSVNVKNGDGSEVAVQPMDYFHGLPENCMGYNTDLYLVPSSGVSDVFMVTRYLEQLINPDTDGLDPDTPYRACLFKIRKLNHQDRKWEETIEDDLGDVALFVGRNSSMLISVTTHPIIKRSSVYFTDDGAEWWLFHKDKEGGHDMGVFDLKSKHITKLTYDGDDILSSVCAPIWFIPQF